MKKKTKFIDIKKKDIRGNHKVKIDLRKLKGSRPISEYQQEAIIDLIYDLQRNLIKALS